MKKIYNILRLVIVILLISSLFVNIITFRIVYRLDGDTKITKNLSVMRVNIERLVKQEIENKPNDELIDEIEQMIIDLRSTYNDNNLKLIEDCMFQKSLNLLDENWRELKEAIYDYRSGIDNILIINDLSEENLSLINNLTFIAYEYTETKITDIIKLRPVLFISITIIMILLIILFLSLLFLYKNNNILKNKAYLDELTKLPNRNNLDYQIEKYYKSSKFPKVCIFIDLDNLKTCNDTLGHNYGDKLLSDFSSILLKVFTKYGHIFRFGGDEFIIFINHDNQEQFNDLILKLKQEVEQYNKNENNILISYSIGVAYDKEIKSQNINDLISLADKRMYKDKRINNC